MKLRVLDGENFSCGSCTNCCRNWHVELIAGEAERITSLNWPADDPLHGAGVLLPHAGKVFLAHRPDGACIFLNETNGLCRIHEQFGRDSKPLGCRLYPFQISPTFAQEASVTARYDCPAVRRNTGVPHEAALPELRRFAQQLNVGALPSFDEITRCHLEREQIEAVCEFVVTLGSSFGRDAQRALFIAQLCDWLAIMQTDELDRATLAKLFPVLKQQVEEASAAPHQSPGAMHRMAFRTILGMYLRRDEDVLDGRATRIGRTIAFSRFVILGGGGFRQLGVSHASGKLSNARLFARSDHTLEAPSAQTFSLHWRMVRARLESFTFMGAANGGRDFLSGLRSLALLYPLVRATAKYNAANRGATQVEPGDVEEAVAAIEHSYGRGAVLHQPWARRLERQLTQREVFTRLIMTV